MKRDSVVDALSNAALLARLGEVTSRDHTTTAEMLVVLAEVDRRRMHRAEGYDSLFRYCVDVLRMSGDMAYKRIQVARASRRFPQVLELIADGRLHLTGARLLVPHLTRRNADELLSAAVHRTTLEVQALLAGRFPQADLPTRIGPAPLAGAAAAASPAAAACSGTALDSIVAVTPAGVATSLMGPAHECPAELVSRPVVPSTGPDPAHSMEPLRVHAAISPLAPVRWALQCTVTQDCHELLRYAQALLGHAVPDGDVPAVIERAGTARNARRPGARCPGATDHASAITCR